MKRIQAVGLLLAAVAALLAVAVAAGAPAALGGIDVTPRQPVPVTPDPTATAPLLPEESPTPDPLVQPPTPTPAPPVPPQEPPLPAPVEGQAPLTETQPITEPNVVVEEVLPEEVAPQDAPPQDAFQPELPPEEGQAPVPEGVAWADPLFRPKVDELVQPLFDNGYAVGFAIAFIEGGETLTLGYGETARGSGQTPDGATLFQIGSLTQTFVGAHLADMVRRSVVRLEDPIHMYLPPTLAVPAWGDRNITLGDLATHRSGLPPYPPGYLSDQFAPAGSDYTATDMLTWLSGYRLTRPPGERYEYSPLGMALLGYILGNVNAAPSWEDAALAQIMAPLDMRDTRSVVSAEQRARLARGHRANGEPVVLERMGILSPAGSLLSTTDDLGIWVRATMGLVETPLRDSLLGAASRQAAAEPGVDAGLGWLRLAPPNADAVFADSVSLGFSASILFDPAVQRGVIVLGNQASAINRDLAVRLYGLLARQEVQPLPVRTAIPMDPAALVKFTGEYQVAAGAPAARVALYADGLLRLAMPGGAWLALYPEDEAGSFFIKGAPSGQEAVVFALTPEGIVTGMSVSLGGQPLTLAKVR